MKYRVNLLFDNRQDSYHAAKVHAGLDALAARKTIVYKLVVADPVHLMDPTTLLLEVESSESKERRLVVIDLRDKSDVFTHDVLRRCNVYFKRNYFTPGTGTLKEQTRSKIVPFGLNHACATPSSKRRCLTVLPKAFLSAGLVPPRQLAARLPLYLRILRA